MYQMNVQILGMVLDIIYKLNIEMDYDHMCWDCLMYFLEWMNFGRDGMGG